MRTPPPLRNQDAPHRNNFKSICHWCQRDYYAVRGPSPKFCSVQCSGQAHHAAAEARKPLSPKPEASASRLYDIQSEMLRAMRDYGRRTQ